MAAVAGYGKGIIGVTDQRFDLGHTSGDGLPKIHKVSHHWVAMFAGEDASNAPSVLAAIANVIRHRNDLTRPEVEQAFREQMQLALEQEIEAAVLGHYRLTVQEFLKTGAKRFTPEIFAQLHYEISQVRLGFEFLVFGFDERSLAHIFTVEERGIVRDRTALSCWAIGSGAAATVNTMLFHDYSWRLPLRTAAYYACAGKFMAERAGLSQATRAVCLMRDGRLLALDDEEIRKVWEANGRPQIPDNIWEMLPPFFALTGALKPTDDLPPDDPEAEPPVPTTPKGGRKSRKPSRA